jgi:uncharacterized protein YjbJ (UPF0337 family)
MNWDQVEGNWSHVKGKVKVKWDRLTADDLMAAAGRRDLLVGKRVERYGYATEQAEQERNVQQDRAEYYDDAHICRY